MSIDSIRINNLKVPARHGVYEFEKEKDGIFEIDLELFSSLYKSGESDKLEDTIKGFTMIMDGELDHLPEAAFNLKGTIEQAIEAGEKLLEKVK